MKAYMVCLGLESGVAGIVGADESTELRRHTLTFLCLTINWKQRSIIVVILPTVTILETKTYSAKVRG